MNTLILIFLIFYAWPISGADESKKAYCFQFTWPGPMSINNSNNINCTSDKYKEKPCIHPILPTLDSHPPNFTAIWANETEKNLYTQILLDGHTCIKYSDIYNNAVLYASYYCGKVVEDKTIAITSGCFYYQTDGHTIEVCACRSIPGSQPCNTATKRTSSTVMLLSSIVILFYKFFNK